MGKIDKLINDIDYDNFIKKNKISQSDYLDMCECINKLLKGQAATTICANVAKVFSKYKFNVYQEEVGWIIKENNNDK